MYFEDQLLYFVLRWFNKLWEALLLTFILSFTEVTHDSQGTFLTNFSYLATDRRDRDRGDRRDRRERDGGDRKRHRYDSDRNDRYKRYDRNDDRYVFSELYLFYF